MKTVFRIVKALAAVVIGIVVTAIVTGDPVTPGAWVWKLALMGVVALILKKAGAFDEPKKADNTK